MIKEIAISVLIALGCFWLLVLFFSMSELDAPSRVSLRMTLLPLTLGIFVTVAQSHARRKNLFPRMVLKYFTFSLFFRTLLLLFVIFLASWNFTSIWGVVDDQTYSVEAFKFSLIKSTERNCFSSHLSIFLIKLPVKRRCLHSILSTTIDGRSQG